MTLNSRIHRIEDDCIFISQSTIIIEEHKYFVKKIQRSRLGGSGESSGVFFSLW